MEDQTSFHCHCQIQRNYNLTNKINFIHSVLNDTNFNITTKIEFVNTTLNNVNFNLTAKINFVDSLINSTQLNEYPINLTGVPTGKGMYQQLITIKDPSKYGINVNGSNIAFYDGSNQTQLYAWEQSINSTAMQVWVKNYNDSSTIDMRVLPSSENLFSATGYLGYGREYFNAPDIFVYATDFKNLNNFTIIAGSPQFVSNGVNLTGTSIISDSKYNISSYRFIWNWTTSITSTSNYNYVGFVNGSSFDPPYYSLYNIEYYLDSNNTKI